MKKRVEEALDASIYEDGIEVDPEEVVIAEATLRCRKNGEVRSDPSIIGLQSPAQEATLNPCA